MRIIEVGHDGEDYFLAMELVQGKPLSAVLRKAAREHRPPSPALTSFIVAQAAAGSATRTRSPTATAGRWASSTATSRRRTS